jgi:hypothetical protein
MMIFRASLILLLLPFPVLAQSAPASEAAQAPPATMPAPPKVANVYLSMSRHFLRQLVLDHVRYILAESVARALLQNSNSPDTLSVKGLPPEPGAVFVAFEIDRQGNVRHAMVSSGPRPMRAPALRSVRRWKFRPFTVEGKPVVVATSVRIAVSNPPRPPNP